MGNRNANEEHNNNNVNGAVGLHEEILIQNDNQTKVLPPSVKKIYTVHNPFCIKKTSLSLEKDAEMINLFYIKFIYDSLVDFNCYINFNVSMNPSKPLIPKDLDNSDNYILSFLPSTKFVSKSIAIKNLPKGENMEFFEKEAVIDINYFNNYKSDINDIKENQYDLSIELVPIYENNDNLKSQNEIVFVSLCNFEQNEIDNHPHSIKIELQKLKTYGMWIDIHDIYNSSLENGECLICCSALRNTIFLPCRHACTCDTCAHSLKMRNNPCPICKKAIKDLLILDVEEQNNFKQNLSTKDFIENNEPNEHNFLINYNNKIINNDYQTDNSENDNEDHIRFNDDA